MAAITYTHTHQDRSTLSLTMHVRFLLLVAAAAAAVVLFYFSPPQFVRVCWECAAVNCNGLGTLLLFLPLTLCACCFLPESTSYLFKSCTYMRLCGSRQYHRRTTTSWPTRPDASTCVHFNIHELLPLRATSALFPLSAARRLWLIHDYPRTLRRPLQSSRRSAV